MTSGAEEPTAKRAKRDGQHKVVRRDPEKRRQQNIQAQKKYREKQRQRLEELERLAASLVSTQDATSATIGSGCFVDAVSQQREEPQPHSPQSFTALSRLETYIPVPASAPAKPHKPHPQKPETFLDLNNIPFPIIDDPQGSWSPNLSVDPSLLVVDGFKFNDNSNYPFLITTDIDCGCAIPHQKIWTHGNGHSGIMPSSPFSIHILTVTAAGQGQSLSDPYMNNLRVERICITSAIWQNCLQIGLCEDTFCEDDCISPFFRPTRAGADQQQCLTTPGDLGEGNGGAAAAKIFVPSSTETMIRTVQAIFRALKPDLRPSREQIIEKHHPCIDVLPFPTLRKNYIVNQGTFDEDEFFRDMLSGLICWGGAGVGRSDRDGVGSGSPWDHRSWESRDWFLRKYWVWLGGEDGELVRQSEWWRRMRGDESDPLQVVS